MDQAFERKSGIRSIRAIVCVSLIGAALFGIPGRSAVIPQRADDRLPELELAGLAKDDPRGREDWFLKQRSYPFDALPVEARRRAWKDHSRPEFSLLRADAAVWRPIGPVPTLSAFPVNWGVTSGRINAIAISPADAHLMLIGASTGGIWRSTDEGYTFVPVSDDQIDLAVGAIAFAPSEPSTVYAGMGDTKMGYLGTGVLKSTDSGLTWRRVNDGTLPAPGTTAAIAVDPVDPGRVYLAQYTRLAKGRYNSSGFFVSSNGGVTWGRRLSGLARDLLIDPAEPQTLYLGMARVDETGGQRAGLYRSTNGGEQWTLIYTTPYDARATFDVRVAKSAVDPQTLYVYTGGLISEADDYRVEVSLDNGVTWLNQRSRGVDTAQFGYNTYLYADPSRSRTLYLGSRDLYRSTNAGVSWTNLTKAFTPPGNYHPRLSLTHPDQHALAFLPGKSEVIYIGNDGGLSLSTDGGGTFSSLNATLSLSQFVGMALHPTDRSVTYGGTQDNGTQWRRNSSMQWLELISGDGGNCVIDPLDASIVFTTFVFGSVFRWSSAGEEFAGIAGSNLIFGEPSNSPRIAFYAPFTGNGVDSTLYFGTWRLFTSTDRGETWTAPAVDLDQTKGGFDVLSAIGVGPADLNLIYTGSAQGRAMVSSDRGTTWQDVTSGLPDRWITDIEVHPRSSSTAYLAVSGFRSGHLFKTTDRGASWLDVSGNLPDLPVNAVLIDPLNHNVIYAGTDLGVFRSLTGGVTWESFNAGIPPVVIAAFAAQPGGLIQVATYGRGCYELEPAAFTSVRAKFGHQRPERR
ncbi:MAG: hypothetical protein HY650_04505 [Acidobacteria bacterium]|nr:hypothetical protein [Acidobacteriota bacterium]